jgi:hypothetical protein
MATVNKDFKIKSGLIVEGTTGTINGEDILTTSAASTQHIIDIVGGETLITSVESTQLEVVSGELNVKANVFDAYGAAATAESNANTYTNGEITTALTTAQGYADTAETNANTYTNNAVFNLASESYVNTAVNNAIDGFNSDLLNYTPTADLDTTVGGYGYIKSADLSGYATENYVNTAVDNLVDGAPGLLDTLNELAAAINDDANYATTMTTALAGKQATLTPGANIDITNDVIAVTGLDTDDVAEGTNLYFTDARALSATASAYDGAGSAANAQTNAENFATSAINALTTDDIEEGVANEYFTDARAKDSAAALLTTATLTNITITGTGNGGLTITAENGVADSNTDDLAEGTNNLYFTDERAIDAISNADIYPNAVILDNVAKQVATSQVVTTASTVGAVTWAKADYRSAELLVKVAYGDHTEVAKVLLTLDVNDNIAITEYGIVGTNGSGMTIGAAIVAGTNVQLQVTTLNNNSTVTAVGTLLV